MSSSPHKKRGKALRPTRVRSVWEETVKVTFRDKSKSLCRVFTVHKLPLCRSSTLFRTAFTGLFKEATGQEISMLDDDSKLFDMFLEWVDSGRINEIKGRWRDCRWSLCVRLMAFSEKIGGHSFRRYLMDSIIKAVIKNNKEPGSRFLPKRQHIMEVFELLPVASERIMEYMLIVFSFHPDISLDQDLPKEFLVKVGEYLKRTNLGLTRQERQSAEGRIVGNDGTG
ncbi:MAG: hypothetical protein Q9187_004446 [Circinaria calcarea]